MSKVYELIPRPLAQRWRDLRLKYVPVVAYVVGIGMVAWLWNTHWMPGTFSGEVQATVANVASPQDGQLASLAVRPYERVRQGQVLGQVSMSPGAAEAAFGAIRAELGMMRQRMVVDGQRNRLSYERVKADELEQRVELAIARSRLGYAESELARQEALRQRQIVSQWEYEQAMEAREALAEEVRERQAGVEQMGEALAGLEPGGETDASRQALEAMDAVIGAEEERFRSSTQAVLRSPIDGVVTRVYRLVGENVFSGEPLLTISSERAENILGFVRHPGEVAPEVGDVVVVRSRRGNRPLAGEGTIVAVGARMELFTRPLRVRGFDNAQERGLPVLITIPPELSLYPGELVDLSFTQ